MSSEVIGERHERLHEQELAVQRLSVVQDEAIRGTHGEPLAFFASTEIELGIMENQPVSDILISDEQLTPEQQTVVDEYEIVMPQAGLKVPHETPDEQENRRNALRLEAASYIEALEPENTAEAIKKERWLRNISTFTTEDLIYFRLYREFATPTLGSTAPPVSPTYAEMAAYSQEQGWLEFRFGNGTFQEGYYDNPGIGEMRFTPCEPDELVRREAIVLQRLADIAAGEGYIVVKPTRHANLSAYRPVKQDGAVEWQPVLNPSSRAGALSETLDATSGIIAAIEDGAWMTEKEAADRFLFGGTIGHERWTIGPTRESLRLLDGYVELRERKLVGSTAHALLLLMGGVMYGLEQGRNQLEDQGYSVAQPTLRHRLERTSSFDKTADVQFLRALEQSAFDTDSGFVIQSNHRLARGEKIADSILGPDVLTKADAFIFSLLMGMSLIADDEGRLRFSTGIFRHLYKELPQNMSSLLSPAWDSDGVDRLGDAAAAYVARDAVRVCMDRAVVGAAHYPGLEPDAWVERWRNSPIFQRMYGEHAAAYAAQLGATARQHYVPIDFNDEESFRQALTELADRIQNP